MEPLLLRVLQSARQPEALRTIDMVDGVRVDGARSLVEAQQRVGLALLCTLPLEHVREIHNIRSFETFHIFQLKIYFY